MAFHLSALFNHMNTQTPVNHTTANVSADGTVQNTVLPPDNAANGAGSNAGLSILQNMLAGETFTGHVIGMQDNTVLLQMMDGNSFSARFSDGAAIQVGQYLTFMVEENSDSNISLKPLMTGEQQALLIGRALDAADFPATEGNINIVKELLNQNMSVDADTIAEMVKNNVKFPDASLNTIASLIKLDIPVTAENIAQFEAYKSYEHSITKELNSISDQISGLLSELAHAQENGADITQGMRTFHNLVQAFYGTQNSTGQAESAPLSAYMDSQALEKLAKQVTDAFSDAAAINSDKNMTEAGMSGNTGLSEAAKQQLSQLTQGIADGSLTTQQLLKQMTELLRDNPNALGKFMDSKEMDGLLKQMINETLKLAPSDVAKEDGIKNYYKRVRETIEKAEDAAGKQGGVDLLSKSMESIKSNIDFMNDLNKNMTYFQMPIHFSESDANGELYVFTNKKALANGADHVSAMLHLDMDHLGAVDVYVKLAGKNVSTNFCLESPEMLDFVYANIDKLNARLEALGYAAHFEMKVAADEKPFDFVTDFVEKEQVILPTTQYIFDTKA